MKSHIIAFFLGVLTPVFMGISTLVLLPLYFKMHEYRLLFPCLGIIGITAIIFSITFFLNPKLIEKIIEKITPKIFQKPGLEESYARGLFMTIISLICWLINQPGSLKNLF
jgi:hypothetical protein